MAETTERVLSLLGLLQQRPVWTGPELAERLGVTTRSVRRDVERLRGLGYPVLATQGVGGGYQLGRGKGLPPLLLDDSEAVAVAVSLRMAAGGTVSGASEAVSVIGSGSHDPTYSSRFIRADFNTSRQILVVVVIR